MHNDQWSSYWQNGVATSFGSQQPLWYERTLTPFWRQVFSALPAHSEVLDVASGNGAVSRIAAQLSEEQNKQLRILAVDKSALSPATKDDPLLSDVEFVPHMPLEKLELEGQSFRLVASQFGIEYSALNKSLAAVAAVMQPGSELVIVAHNVDSIICSHSRDELQQYREILGKQAVFEKLALLVKSMGEIRSKTDLAQLVNRPQTEKRRKSFNSVIAKLMGKYPEGTVVADVLSRINPLFREKVGSPLATKLAYIQTLQQEFKQAQMRLIDLLNAAVDEKGLRRFQTLSENHGLHLVSTEELSDDVAGLLAWVIRLETTK